MTKLSVAPMLVLELQDEKICYWFRNALEYGTPGFTLVFGCRKA
jgi:hypothetical protein